ncbi:MAG: hypothetical protein ABFS24_14190 [Pseudomonadota bacterium]
MKYNLFARSRMVMVVLAICLLSPAVLARSTELVEPDPVTISCNLPAG